MRKVLTRGNIIAAIICLVALVGGIFLGNFASKTLEEKQIQKLDVAIEAGKKISDIEWLNALGEISNEEVDRLNNQIPNATSDEEAIELMDELLEGRKEEYFAKCAEHAEMIAEMLSLIDERAELDAERAELIDEIIAHG